VAADDRRLVRELFVTAEAFTRHADIVDAAERHGASVTVVAEAVAAAMAETVTPQGVVAVVGFCDVPLETALDGTPALVAVLAAVRDPGNAGTVIRVADAAGADAVVLTDTSVDPYNGKCVRASAGSLFHLPVVTGAPVEQAVEALRAAGLTVLAADAAPDADDLDDLADQGALAAPTAWLFGNEAWGLPDGVRALADRVVRVPVHGRAESLNLASAAAICLYASARERRGRSR
jgi:TrmH family RNA methyltransferase